MSKGFALGEVLPTAYVELEFPPITTAASKGGNEHCFSGHVLRVGCGRVQSSWRFQAQLGCHKRGK
jgi:hypothetical protein